MLYYGLFRKHWPFLALYFKSVSEQESVFSVKAPLDLCVSLFNSETISFSVLQLFHVFVETSLRVNSTDVRRQHLEM